MLNRVEQWTAHLAAELRAHGYGVRVDAKTNWQETDFPTRAEVDRIRANVDALQTGFYSLPDWREIIYNNTLDFGQANALEWDLQCLYDWLARMAAHLDWRRSGEIVAGETP